MTPLTTRQQDALEFIRSRMADGWPVPSIREIAAHLGLSSPSAAHLHVKALERKGLLSKDINAARSLRLTGSQEKRVPGIPLLGAIPAGHGDLRTQEPDGMVYVDVDSLRIPKSHRTFALRVTGDSMMGRHILDGDFVVLEHGPEPRHGQIVAALIDGASTLKTFVMKGGKPYLRAENPKYPDLIPAQELMIQGVFKALIRRAKE